MVTSAHSPPACDESPRPAIHAIGTAVPDTVLRQDDAREIFRSQSGRSALARRLIGATFDASAIDTRRTVIDEFNRPSSGQATFFNPKDGAILSPSTATRNEIYNREAPALGLRAAAQALNEFPGLDSSEITHVVTVSCTGFSAPGLDIALVSGLGLRHSTRRMNVGFMGCYGAFPALHHATAVCSSEPDAVVLVVCVELCSLHLRGSDDPDTILSSSLFADGAAAALISAHDLTSKADTSRAAGAANRRRLEIAAMETVVTQEGSEHMSWTIGDLGFEMVLSSYVPRILEANIADALEPLRRSRPDLVPGPWAELTWAIHPGGRSILDRVQTALGLEENSVDASRAVLREFGNMSSATVLFVLQRLLHHVADNQADQNSVICAAAFGPGLTVESALFVLRGAP